MLDTVMGCRRHRYPALLWTASSGGLPPSPPLSFLSFPVQCGSSASVLRVGVVPGSFTLTAPLLVSVLRGLRPSSTSPSCSGLHPQVGMSPPPPRLPSLLGMGSFKGEG